MVVALLLCHSSFIRSLFLRSALVTTREQPSLPSERSRLRRIDEQLSSVRANEARNEIPLSERSRLRRIDEQFSSVRTNEEMNEIPSSEKSIEKNR